jgi:hypothetical protein
MAEPSLVPCVCQYIRRPLLARVVDRRIAEIFARGEFGDWFARMVPLVESGRREFYNIENE